MDAEPTEWSGDQIPDKLAVVHVEPLGGRDEGSGVTRPRLDERREKEVHVEAG